MKCNVAAIWQEHKNYMEGFIRKRIEDEELAKDILQEVVLKMCEFCLKRNDVKNTRNWLYQITSNVIIDHFRKEQKKSALFTVSEQKAHPEEESFYESASDCVNILIEQLPEKYRVPLMWSDIEQIPQAEIAKKLNMSLSDTKSRVQRARIQLKELFYECCNLEVNHLGNVSDYEPKDTSNLIIDSQVLSQ